MRFKPGQEITPKEEFQGLDHNDKPIPPWCTIPKVGQIFTVESYDGMYFGEWYLCLAEVPLNQSFNENRFAPVMNISELTEILNHQPQEV